MSGELVIKNIILYDPWQQVSGFVELKTGNSGKTQVKVRHNLYDKDLLLSIVAGGESQVFTLPERTSTHEISAAIDMTKEVVACLMQKDGNKVSTLASGAINLMSNEKLIMNNVGIIDNIVPEGRGGLEVILADTEILPISRKVMDDTPKTYQTEAAHEIDELLRAVCTVDDQGRGICETCPYREHFFGEPIFDNTKEIMLQ